MIPKVIHYCWFGGNPLPDLAIKCLKSWKEFFPDYEIKEWNESNFDVTSCVYVKEAYEAKKWAFVSDYVRFKILYENGGLYFDTDVELIKPMDDIIHKGAFIGREKVLGKYPVNAGLGIGIEPRNSLYREILNDYDSSHFLNEDGSYNMTTVVDRVTNIMKRYGLTERDEYQKIKDIHVYPSEYFCPFDYNTGELHKAENTRTIHWYDASWFDDKMRKRRKVCEKIQRIARGKMGERISKLYMSLSYNWEMICKGDGRLLLKKIKTKLLLKG